MFVLKVYCFLQFQSQIIDFVTDLKQQSDEVTENLCRIYEWISKSVNVENFFANLLVHMSKEKIPKT